MNEELEDEIYEEANDAENDIDDDDLVAMAEEVADLDDDELEELADESPTE